MAPLFFAFRDMVGIGFCSLLFGHGLGAGIICAAAEITTARLAYVLGAAWQAVGPAVRTLGSAGTRTEIGRQPWLCCSGVLKTDRTPSLPYPRPPRVGITLLQPYLLVYAGRLIAAYLSVIVPRCAPQGSPGTPHEAPPGRQGSRASTPSPCDGAWKGEASPWLKFIVERMAPPVLYLRHPDGRFASSSMSFSMALTWASAFCRRLATDR